MQATSLVSFPSVLDPASNLQSQQKFRPKRFILLLVAVGHDLLRCSHGKGVLYLELDSRGILFLDHLLLVFLKDAEDHAVDDEPVIFPEENKESLYLVEGNHLGEESHDPILAQDEHIDSSLR